MSPAQPVDLMEFLRPEDRITLRRCCDVLGIPLQSWRDVDWLGRGFEVLAVEAQADRIQLRTGRGHTWCVAEAAFQLGIPYNTHLTRIKRAKADARGVQSEPRRPPPPSLRYRITATKEQQ